MPPIQRDSDVGPSNRTVGLSITPRSNTALDPALPSTLTTMIIAEEKTSSGPSSPSLAQYPSVPPGYFTNRPLALVPASSSSSNGGSAGLGPPPHWPKSPSESVLPLASPSSPPLSATQSHTYLPAAPPQPPSLSRPPPSNLPTTAFRPMFLLAQLNSLQEGFPSVLPPSTGSPHPFSLYDITETDWTQFIADLRTVANLSSQDHETAYSVPLFSHLPFISVAIAATITHHIGKKKPKLVGLVVDKWNHHFFHPRKMEVILMRGEKKLSGQSDQPVANLYTPRTVNFTPPPPPEASHGGDKTYRLFVVSMEA
ncbi:hypothetical protein DFH07DRAFT_333629 [Mycena maculata]|uniref:Uncharacterized protein n=1 Tax=Mycena maculata TaxID=230809 RepID=A0AAD7HDQ1_9AGAR|nr:hypothetical protein DFH07DRAFT_333629 [Mycena maculata]